mgnify:CR=1 FL=1
MINKIMKLSKIFIKDYFENLYIFNKDTYLEIDMDPIRI